MTSPSLLRHARLGAYTIEREIGRGGMATVYEGIHAELGRRVAIKVMSDALRDRAVAMARFGREARILAKLRHPHIVAATDIGTWEGRPYFVMDLVEGVTLAAHRKALGRIAIEPLVEIILPVAAAVSAAHASHVVHRDLKPSNVLLEKRGASRVRPIVLDFGISKSIEDDERALTGTDSVIGTVAYLSPEQVRAARNATAKSDQYALGVVLYECATGSLPFAGESSYVTMHAIVTEDPRPPSERCAGLPAAFDAIVLRAMQRDPAQRFPDVQSLARALLPLADARTVSLWRDELERMDDTPSVRTSEPAPDAPVASVASGDATLTEERALAVQPIDRSRPIGPARWMTQLVAGGGVVAAIALLSIAAGRRPPVSNPSTAAPLAPEMAAHDVTARAPAAQTPAATASSVTAAPQLEPHAVAPSTPSTPSAPSGVTLPPPRAPIAHGAPRGSKPSAPLPAASTAPPAGSNAERGTNDVPILE